MLWTGYRVNRLKRDLERAKNTGDLDESTVDLEVAVGVPIVVASQIYGDDVGNVLYDEVVRSAHSGRSR